MMAAANEQFPWTSYYGHYNYFEQRMKNHKEVYSLSCHGSGLYELVRVRGDTLRVFICECYAFGVAEYMETTSQLGAVNTIVINSNWCGYTIDVKRVCRADGVGLFDISEFMGALCRDDYWRYLTKRDREYFRKQGWL